MGKMLPGGLFDKVIVVSLPTSADRRQHIEKHFSEIGIRDYAFFDAQDSKAQNVQLLFEEGKVSPYPPCFRCGKLECGKPDCNNVLTPQQVAVFSTYLSLWRSIAPTDYRVLVCEDDVLFHSWAGRTLRALEDTIAAGDLTFHGSKPAMLRLGWALCEDHNEALDFRIDHSLRMANPCHAVTSAYARALLEEFERVEHTVDVYQHRLAAVATRNAWTIFPPIASELSWSVGCLPSLIHPKENHANYLESTGRLDEAEQYRREISSHFQNIAHRKPV